MIDPIFHEYATAIINHTLGRAGNSRRFCRVYPVDVQEPLEAPGFIRYIVQTGKHSGGRPVLLRDVDTAAIRMEMDEHMGNLINAYMRYQGLDTSELPKDLVSFTSRPFSIQIPNPSPMQAIPWEAGGSARRIPLGLTHTWAGPKIIYWDLDKDAHAIIAGTTGSGKSVMLHSLLGHMVANTDPAETEIVLVDAKNRSLHHFEAAPHVRRPVAYRPEDMVAAIKAVEDEVSRRSADRTRTTPTIILAVDEMTDVLAGDKALQEWLERIANMGRELGIHLVGGTQKPMLTKLGQALGQMTLRIVGRMASSDDAKRVAKADVAANTILQKGTFYAVVGANVANMLQGYLITPEQIAGVVAEARRRCPAPSPTVLVAPQGGGAVTGKDLAAAAAAQQRAEEDLAVLLGRFGWDELRELDPIDPVPSKDQKSKGITLNGLIEAIGVGPNGRTFYDGKKRIINALSIYHGATELPELTY
ncbi:MAG: type IV secretion system DNA-binding domain-containing protein [Caldilineaceae bacterium]|nr:type IV secretion system DNA-binding domain-containing protein [Caldilineaceae bacterium]